MSVAGTLSIDPPPAHWGVKVRSGRIGMPTWVAASMMASDRVQSKVPRAGSISGQGNPSCTSLAPSALASASSALMVGSGPWPSTLKSAVQSGIWHHQDCGFAPAYTQGRIAGSALTPPRMRLVPPLARAMLARSPIRRAALAITAARQPRAMTWRRRPPAGRMPGRGWLTGAPSCDRLAGGAQHLGDLGAGVLHRQRLAPAQQLAHPGSTQGGVLFGGMRAGPRRGHPPAAPAPEGMLKAQDLDAQLPGQVLVEDSLGGVGVVVAANPGMISAHDEMG